MNRLIERFYQNSPFSNTLGLARSLLALSLLCTLIFSPAELLFSGPHGFMEGNVKSIHRFTVYGVFGEYLVAAKYFSLVVLIFVIAGIYPRFTGIFHWWVSVSFFLTSPYVDGGDQVCSILSFLLIPITLCDNRKNHWIVYSNPPSFNNLIANVGLTVIGLQVSVIYLHAAIAKVSITEWLNGTVIYYWFTHNTFGLNPILEPLILPIITNNYLVYFITWCVLVLELSLFACILANHRIKKTLFICGVFFHFLIFLVHGLGSFALAMTSALILYLLPSRREINFIAYFKSLTLFFKQAKQSLVAK